MPMDIRGLALTTGNNWAAERYNTAVERYLEFRADAADALREALLIDPLFVMANVLLGVLFRQEENDALLPQAAHALAAAQAAAAHAGRREQAHVEALRLWLSKDIRGANRIYAAILREEPRDLLALKCLMFNALWLGESPLLRDVPRDVLRRVDPHLPGYGYILGMQAFGLEECGEYADAERAGRAALVCHRGDLWAIHAVAQVFEMQCRLREGLDWLDESAPVWAGGFSGSSRKRPETQGVARNTFAVHLWWHRALYLFELEQWEAVLRLYDGHIRSQSSDFWLDVQNAASLLWRLDLRGVDVGGRWTELADVSAQRVQDLAQPFTSVHYVMALLRAGRPEIAMRHIGAMRQADPPLPRGRADWASRERSAAPHPAGADTLAPIFAEVAAPVCEGLVAYAEAVYSRASERIMTAFGKLQSLGGSHAQRDVIVLTLIQCARDGGYLALARDLMAARTRAKPGSADAWHTYARVLELSRDMAGATVARATGDAIAERAKGTS